MNPPSLSRMRTAQVRASGLGATRQLDSSVAKFFLAPKESLLLCAGTSSLQDALLCCAVLTSRVLLRLSTSRIRISSLRVDQSTHRSTLRSVSLETAGCRCMLNHCRNDRGRTTRDEQCECGEDARGWRRAPRAERGGARFFVRLPSVSQIRSIRKLGKHSC